MTPGLAIVALAALLSNTADAPKVPGAAAGAPVTVSTAEVVAAEVAARLAATPTARPALSSKAELAAIVGYAESYLATPIVVSLQRQRAGTARFAVRDMHRNDPNSGDAVFANDGSGLAVGAAYVSFDAIAGQSYVVECAGGLSRWTLVRYRPDGAARIEDQRVVLEGTPRPSLVFAASRTEPALVAIVPVVPVGDERTISRCQIARVDAVGDGGGAAKPVK